MKHIKLFFFFILILHTSPSIQAQSSTYSTKMADYYNGCKKILEGIVNKDKYALYEAKEYFAKVNIENIYPVCKMGIKNEKKAEIFFCQEYADALIKNHFLLNNIDDISIMRNADESDLLVFHRAIDAHGILDYDWEGCDDCELTLITTKKGKMKVTVIDKTTGKEYEAQPDEQGIAYHINWNMGETENTYSIRVENMSDDCVSFVIALN